MGFGGFWGGFGGADNVLGCPPYKIFSWTCCYAIHSSLAPYPGTRYQLLLVTCKTLLIFALLFLGGGFWGGFGGADNVLGCPPYKIFSWTCCYAIHSSLAPYPGTRYQLLLVTCKTLLIFALLFLGGGFWGGFGGGADNVLGCPPYKIFSWTCCYAIHSSLAPYPGTRYQLLLVSCKTLLIFALLFLGGVLGGADNVLECEQVTHQVKQFTRPVMRKTVICTQFGCRYSEYWQGMAYTQSLATPKIEDIRKDKWPSQNESRCAFNDPAMDVASNNFAVFSQRIDVMPCRSAEEISLLSMTASSTETNSLTALQMTKNICFPI